MLDQMVHLPAVGIPYDKFREGQSGPQTPQTVFDADFEGLTSNAELYIFNQEDSQEQAWAYLGYVLVYAKGYVV